MQIVSGCESHPVTSLKEKEHLSCMAAYRYPPLQRLPSLLIPWGKTRGGQAGEHPTTWPLASYLPVSGQANSLFCRRYQPIALTPSRRSLITFLILSCLHHPSHTFYPLTFPRLRLLLTATPTSGAPHLFSHHATHVPGSLNFSSFSLTLPSLSICLLRPSSVLITP